ncbi:MAG: hypothetical protein H6Q90_3860 [Deltaproteobacteria bacterium]|nr:hypothetical protein [Deltaproteobacteria bacterium]
MTEPAPAAPPRPRASLPWARLAAAVWGAMMLSGLVIGAVGPASWRDALAHDGPGCPFRRTTGIDCPFCGMTRGTLAIGGGEWRKALDFHPFAPLVLFGMLALMVIIVAGRADLLLRGKRPYYVLGSIIAIWILRLVL